MAAKTRAQILALAMQLAGEIESPDADFIWKPIINRLADDVAERTKCLYTSYTQDIVSAQAEYCASQLIKLKSVRALDAGGRVIPLVLTTAVDYDGYGVNWRTSPSTGTPRLYMTNGLNTATIYPTPNYSTSGGITLEGIGIPGASWDADSATCPLPESMHDALAMGAAAFRIMTDDSQDLTAAREKKAGYLQAQFDNAWKKLWRRVIGLRGGAHVLGNISQLSDGYTFAPVV